MPAPRFETFRPQQQAQLSNLDPIKLIGTLGALQTQQLQQQKLQKEIEEKKEIGLERLIGPAAEVESHLELLRKYPKDSAERKLIEKHWNAIEDAKNATAAYLKTNLSLKNLPEAQRQQLILQTQETTGAPLSDVVKALSFDPSSQSSIENQKNVISQITEYSEKDKQIANKQMIEIKKILGKKVGDPEARKSISPLLDMNRVINEIDAKSIAKFSGPLGRSRYITESAWNILGGKPSEDYKKARLYHTKQAKAIADAMRQLLKTSVQPGYVREMILPLTNIDTWRDSPEIALSNFNYIKKWLNDRLGLFIELSNKGTPITKEEVDNIFAKPSGVTLDLKTKQFDLSPDQIKKGANKAGMSEKAYRLYLQEHPEFFKGKL